MSSDSKLNPLADGLSLSRSVTLVNSLSNYTISGVLPTTI